jgi:hypothetical protein
MENIESIIYSRGVTNAKKKIKFTTKKPLKNNKNIKFKSKKVVEVVVSPSETCCCEKKDTRKTTIVLKRKKIQINTEEIIKSMEKLKIVSKNNIIMGNDMYYIDDENNVVSEEYTGNKRICIAFPRCSKVVSNITDKKDIPVRFLNAFGRLKKKSMLNSYDDKFHCWNSISEKSKNHWKMLSYNSDTLEKMLLSNGIDATLFWCSLFS